MQQLHAERQQTLHEGHVAMLRHVFAPFDQHLVQGAQYDQQVRMIFAGIDHQQVSIQMAVETERINVEHFTLARENGENRWDAMQLFAIAEIFGFHDVVQHLNKIGEKVQIDDVRKSEKFDKRYYEIIIDLNDLFIDKKKMSYL